MMVAVSCFAFFVLLLFNTIEAFLPRAFVVSSSRVASGQSVQISPSPLAEHVSSISTSLPDSSPLLASSSVALSSALDVLKTVGAVGVGFALLLIGLAFVFSNYVIPQAAKELEEQARQKFPDLWQEYQAKLDETGETLIMRPDLMQELGNKVQERLMAEFDSQQEAQQTPTAAPSESEAPSKSSGAQTNVVDAEFTKEKESE